MLNEQEAKQILAKIEPIFDEVSGRYDFATYPAEAYDRFKQTFASLREANGSISDALLWKYGRSGRGSYPQSYQRLIEDAERLWPAFVTSGAGKVPLNTFNWWIEHLDRKHSYITVAFITHLVHHAQIPIIDQHNFRAMNSLLSAVRANHQGKKKPSRWADIVQLKEFIDAVHTRLGNASLAKLDRFLMMYGRDMVPR